MAGKSIDVDLGAMPGHLARRVHQLSVALFVQEVGAHNLTPLQYSSLQTICSQPGIDQKTLAHTIGFDTSTIAGVIDRLEFRGLVVRNVSPADKRIRLVTPTAEGKKMLKAVVPCMLRAQDGLLQPLKAAERKEFMRLMKLIIDANAEMSNIPAKE